MSAPGFYSRGAKIASRSEFHRMVEEWHDPDETEEVAALEAFWVTEYGLAAGRPGTGYSVEQIALGREVNDLSCIGCHSRPQTAMVGYAVSRLLTPFGRNKDRGGLVSFAYWLHLLVALGLLAWLPFGKMRHVVTALLGCIADRTVRPAPDVHLRARETDAVPGRLYPLRPLLGQLLRGNLRRNSPKPLHTALGKTGRPGCGLTEWKHERPGTTGGPDRLHQLPALHRRLPGGHRSSGSLGRRPRRSAGPGRRRRLCPFPPGHPPVGGVGRRFYLRTGTPGAVPKPGV